MQIVQQQSRTSSFKQELPRKRSFDSSTASSSDSSKKQLKLSQNLKPHICESDEQARNVTPTLFSPFRNKNYSNLTSQGHVLFASDEWFATADNLLKDSSPVFIPDLYCAQGKVMDGWETRRRRVAGHDWCVIALNSVKGDIYGIELDTAFFTGNQTPRVSIEVANCYDEFKDEEEWKFTWMPGAVTRLAQGGGIQGTGKTPAEVEKANRACQKFTWTKILGTTELKPGYEETRMHYFSVPEVLRKQTKGFTHVRVNYYPDGGVARMRLWGHSVLEEESQLKKYEVNTSATLKSYLHPELSCEINGGEGLSCSNKHYGVPSNLIRKTGGKDMGDGWETARHPERPGILIKDPKTNLIDSPLKDWAILKLGMGGSNFVSRIILDTKHFKGNYPESVMIEGCDGSCDGVTDEMVCATSPSQVNWFPLLMRSRMGPDREHVFERNSRAFVMKEKIVTHIRISIFPDGGLSRVRVYGQPINNMLT